MKERRDRRVAFFLIAAVLCFALVPLADDEFRWVAWGTGGVYVLLAVAAALDTWSRRRQ